MSQARAVGRPADRYGRPKVTNRRNVAILGGTLVILLTGYLIWLSVATTGRTVRFSKLSDSVVGPTGVDVTFQVTMEPGERAVCAVRAKDADLTIVGWSDVTVGPSSESTVTTTVRIPTMQQGAGGEVKACVPA